jgi:hypothetical protein
LTRAPCRYWAKTEGSRLSNGGTPGPKTATPKLARASLMGFIEYTLWGLPDPTR